ncbi:MAG: hypothetical protein HY777_03300 [Betaproteobacteria bacterium]|nr:hypothetical protein [Betaproteobacteria bacterium]
MPARRLLYLSTYRLTAFRWEGGILVGETLFEATDEGYSLFAAYLALHEKSLFTLLANAAEEGFQIETLPFLRGGDRKAIIKRKLGQLFFNAALTAQASLGYEKSRRKNERVLLAALSNNDFFQPWLAALHKAQAALSGIYSLPFLGGVLLEKLKIADERCLLLTVQDQSVRQSYFEKGRLHFSRLTPLQNSSIGGMAQTFATEAHKLQQYLSSQRMIGRGQPIAVHVLAHANARQTIERSCTDTHTLHFNVLQLDACAKRLGMSAQPASSHCESLFLHLLATAAPHTQFAGDGQRHHYRLWQLRYALYGIGALTLFCCLALAGKYALDAHGVRREAGQLAAGASVARERYAAIAQTFPPIPVSHETLRRAIGRYAELEKGNAAPGALYLAISRALDTAGEVRIDGIDWMLGAAPAKPAGGQTEPPPQPGAPGETHEIAIARGTLQLGANATPRQIIAAFDKFLAALKSDPRHQVLVLQHPVDLESGKAIKGGDGMSDDGDNGKPRAFSVRIARKAGA